MCTLTDLPAWADFWRTNETFYLLSLFLNIKREGCVYVEEHVAEVTKIGEGKSLFATKSIYRKPLKNRPNLDVVTTDELDFCHYKYLFVVLSKN